MMQEEKDARKGSLLQAWWDASREEVVADCELEELWVELAKLVKWGHRHIGLASDDPLTLYCAPDSLTVAEYPPAEEIIRWINRRENARSAAKKARAQLDEMGITLPKFPFQK